jgi:hypothetical protein
LGLLHAPIELLARASGADKGDHGFTEVYDRFFADYRNRKVTLLEIGVGGYDKVSGGWSLALWAAYFQRGKIIGIDIHDKTHLSRGRIQVYQCSQIDRVALRVIADRYDGFDIVIDDGSHLNCHQIESFNILFPFLKTPGVYVVEDTQTSYWPAFGGGGVGTAAHRRSAICYFKGLIDGLNHAENFASPHVPSTAFHLQIGGIYFQHNIIAVLKGDNSAESRWPVEWRESVLREREVGSDPMAEILGTDCDQSSTDTVRSRGMP